MLLAQKVLKVIPPAGWWCPESTISLAHKKDIAWDSRAFDAFRRAEIISVDYRKSGLFGKVQGIFWWGEYMRGHADNGVVVNDYSVSPKGGI